MDDRSITETCWSGILTKTEVSRKHLVLVIQLSEATVARVGHISSWTEVVFFFEPAETAGRRDGGIGGPPVEEQPGAVELRGGCTVQQKPARF